MRSAAYEGCLRADNCILINGDTMTNGKNRISHIILALLFSAPAIALAEPDWNKVPSKTIRVFYPGVSSIEWVTKGSEHGGAKGLRKGESCASCHEEELNDIGKKIVSGSKNEPSPLKGKAASIAVGMQAAYDAEYLYLRFSFKEPPKAGGGPDKENEMKLAVMFAGDKVPIAEQVGCWQTCHQDARTMPGADDARTKYVVGGNLAGGIFYDLMQWKSGKGAKPVDGHVSDKRAMEGGKALVKAEGAKKGDTWTVTFTRKLSGGEGDVVLTEGKSVPFGIAVHDDHAVGRFHLISLGYLLGVGTKSDFTAVKQ